MLRILYILIIIIILHIIIIYYDIQKIIINKYNTLFRKKDNKPKYTNNNP